MNKKILKKVNELIQLRKDEFPLIVSPCLGLDLYDFKNEYPYIDENNIVELINDDNVHINLIQALNVQVGTEKGVSTLYLGDKKLCHISDIDSDIVRSLMIGSRLSRVIIIQQEDAVWSMYDTYMQAVFIVSNIENCKTTFKNGRFVKFTPNPILKSSYENKPQ